MNLASLLGNWKLIAIALLVGIGIGWTVHGWKHEAERAATLDKLIAEQEENWAEAVQKEAKRLAGQAERERETETVIEEVIRYVEADPERCGIGPDSVRSLNRLRK